MQKMTRIAAAVTLATASASASSWWGAPWADQSQMLEVRQDYAERFAAEQARVAKQLAAQLAAQQAQRQDAQRKYAEQFVAEQARIAEQIAAQQAEVQAAQRRYAREVAAAQTRIAEHRAAQQAEAQAVQREYAKLLAAQQARIVEAQQSHLTQFAANTPDTVREADAEAFSPMAPPRPFVDPYRIDPLTRAAPMDPFGGPASAVYDERLKESEARRDRWRKAAEQRRSETDKRREAALKNLEERRQTRMKYVGIPKPFDPPTREEI